MKRRMKLPYFTAGSNKGKTHDGPCKTDPLQLVVVSNIRAGVGYTIVFSFEDDGRE